MIDGQTARKIKVAFRVAANMVQRSRTARAVLAGIRCTNSGWK
jgi:hypothetical protein